MKYLLFLSILMCSAVGCKNKLKEGNIVSKWYEPASTTVIVIPITMTDGKNTSVMMVPYFIIDNEDWVIKIQGKYNGKIIDENVYVSQKQFDCVSIGNHFILTKDCSTEDNNNKQIEK